jgi:hypothetical protein
MEIIRFCIGYRKFHSVTAISKLVYSLLPVSHAAFSLASNQTDSLNDFAFQPQGVLLKMYVLTITPWEISAVASLQVI